MISLLEDLLANGRPELVAATQDQEEDEEKEKKKFFASVNKKFELLQEISRSRKYRSLTTRLSTLDNLCKKLLSETDITKNITSTNESIAAIEEETISFSKDVDCELRDIHDQCTQWQSSVSSASDNDDNDEENNMNININTKSNKTKNRNNRNNSRHNNKSNSSSKKKRGNKMRSLPLYTSIYCRQNGLQCIMIKFCLITGKISELLFDYREKIDKIDNTNEILDVIDNLLCDYWPKIYRWHDPSSFDEMDTIIDDLDENSNYFDLDLNSNDKNNNNNNNKFNKYSRVEIIRKHKSVGIFTKDETDFAIYENIVYFGAQASNNLRVNTTNNTDNTSNTDKNTNANTNNNNNNKNNNNNAKINGNLKQEDENQGKDNRFVCKYA